MLKLKLQYLGHLMHRADALEKTLMLGKIEGRRRRGWQRMRWLDGITDSMDMSLSKLWEIVKDRGSLACCSPQGHKELDTTEWMNKSTGKIRLMTSLGNLIQVTKTWAHPNGMSWLLINMPLFSHDWLRTPKSQSERKWICRKAPRALGMVGLSHSTQASWWKA